MSANTAREKDQETDGAVEGTAASGTGIAEHPGYWPAAGQTGHRPGTAMGPGLAVQPTDRLVATTRPMDRWPVMAVKRDRGQLYLQVTTLGPEPARTWVERIDPTTLAPLERSDDLVVGDRPWPGAMAAHANGDLYSVSGRHAHRISSDCRVIADRELPVDHAHHGLVILSDGSMAMTDPRLGSEPSTLTLLDPDLRVLATEALPQPALGRPTAIAEDDLDFVYVPGATHVFRYRWDGATLTLDPDWQPRYRRADQGGVATDPTIANDRIWFHDNGDVPDVERQLSTGLVGSSGGYIAGATMEDTADQVPTWSDPVRLIGISTAEPDNRIAIAPTELPAGWVTAPPLVCGGVAIAADTGNTGLAAFDIAPGGHGEDRAEMLWFQPFRSSIPALLYPEGGELITNDYRFLEDGTTSDDLVVVDVMTGRMKARVATGATWLGGTSLTPGWDRDVYYCARGIVTRIEARAL